MLPFHNKRPPASPQLGSPCLESSHASASTLIEPDVVLMQGPWGALQDKGPGAWALVWDGASTTTCHPPTQVCQHFWWLSPAEHHCNGKHMDARECPWPALSTCACQNQKSRALIECSSNAALTSEQFSISGFFLFFFFLFNAPQ